MYTGGAALWPHPLKGEKEQGCSGTLGAGAGLWVLEPAEAVWTAAA